MCTFKPKNFVKNKKYRCSTSKVRVQTREVFSSKQYDSVSDIFKTGNEMIEDSILNRSKISSGKISEPGYFSQRNLSTLYRKDESILTGGVEAQD